MARKISAQSAGLKMLAVGMAWALGFSGCGLLPPRGGEPAGSAGQESEAGTGEAAAQPVPAGRYEEPGDLDRLVDARPMALPPVKMQATAGSAGPVKAVSEASQGKGRFRIQVGAENDIDAAQAKKQEYERKLGGGVDVVFDAPYYKLRWGYFDSKQDADDKILEIAEFNIQGFVVKQ
jgi:hypothetical protein